MSRVVIVTDSASDLDPASAAAAGIDMVPLVSTFGDEEYLAGVDMTAEQFWARLTAPGAPFPRTAAASAGAFQAAFERAFARGAQEVVCITVAGTLSATLKSAQIAAAAVPGGRVHVIDSWSATMGQGLLALLAAERAAAGGSASEIVAEVQLRIPDLRLYVALETLEYLRRNGRISGARAALGTVLSVKPIITIVDGLVEQADRVRTRSKARERLIELLTVRPLERVALLHAMTPDIDAFGADLARAAGFDRAAMSVHLIGPTIGPHLGPGTYGAVALFRHDPA
jgi:DegV family protein with EDD domain